MDVYFLGLSIFVIVSDSPELWCGQVVFPYGGSERATQLPALFLSSLGILSQPLLVIDTGGYAARQLLSCSWAVGHGDGSFVLLWSLRCSCHRAGAGHPCASFKMVTVNGSTDFRRLRHN